jgi:murein DD-endopeptidase MepM/ murein hydrolase activator NlpD
MRNRKYFLDLNDLQYKQVRIPWRKRLLHLFFFFVITIAITILYGIVFESLFGSPKEKMLSGQVESLVLQYSLKDRELDNSLKNLTDLKTSDEIRYRPILKMDSVPESLRNPGFGGVERFRELNGYINSDLMKSIRIRIEEMKNRSAAQAESFLTIVERSEEWRDEIDHSPAISPVDPSFPMGDGYRFREVHPVLGVGRMHYGQDFYVPYGTNVYATGDGTVIESGWNSGGFGNYVIIDHGYGLQSIYAHLSKINVPKNINIKRGDLIGLSGSTGSLSTGPHLHYQINKYGSPVSAINFFNNDISQEEFNEMIQAFSSKSIFR